MWFYYFIVLILSFLLTAIFVLLVRQIACKKQIVDHPQVALERKIHPQPIPLLGGLAIFLGFFAVVLILAYTTPWLLGKNILAKYLWGIFIGGIFLMLGGYLDDRYHLKPWQQIICPILAIMAVIVSGIGIKEITNPFGGTIAVDSYHFILFWFQGLPYRLTLPADIMTFVWLLGMMYTTKLLDGLDGLVSGVTAIGALIIALLCLVTIFYQPDTALLAIILVGAAAGFTIFNFYPAKIFLGEGGSTFCGFLLGVLAIIAGSKIITTALVMGIPILDVAWVIGRRLFWEKHSPFISDSGHLHFRLLHIGLSHRQAVLFLYILAAGFGLAALSLQSFGKLLALIILLVIMLILGLSLTFLRRDDKIKKNI